MSCTNLRYRCQPDITLVDLPSDVLKDLSKVIGQEFFDRVRAVTFRELEFQNGRYDMYKALYLLGDKEGWKVQRLVPILFEMDNTEALNKLLEFWPPKIVDTPPKDLYLNDRSSLDLNIRVTGHPKPEVEWRNPQNEVVGRGSRLRLNNFQYGLYTVRAFNVDKNNKDLKGNLEFSDSCAFVVHPQRLSDELRTPAWKPTSTTEERPLGHSLAPVKDSIQPVLTSPLELELSSFSPSDRPIGKIALLIGCGNYKNEHYQTLDGPKNDLPAFAQRLAKIDFRVVTLQDLGLDDLHKAINIYLDLLHPRVYGVLYLSGHGTRFLNCDDDFLLPVDAPLERQPHHCLSRQTLIKRLQEKRPALNFVIWDACRGSSNAEDRSGQSRDSYHEHNLFEFRSSLAYTASYETKRGSVIMVPFLKLLGSMQKRYDMDELLMNWKRSVEERNLQTPSILMGGRSKLSLWDKIEQRSGDTQIYYRILKLWSEDTLDADRVFPKLSITSPSPIFGMLYTFLVHNILMLTVVSTDPQWLIGFDWGSLRRWNCFVEIPPQDPSEHPRQIILRDLQRLAASRSPADNSPQADAVRLHCLCRHQRSRDWTPVLFVIRHIRLIQLFRVVQTFRDPC